MEQTGTSESRAGFLPVDTLGDALTIAMEFERSASSLYGDFAERLDPQVRPVLQQLAAGAQAHFDLLQRYAACCEFEQRLDHAAAIWLSAQRFHRSVSLPNLPPEPIEDDLLNYAEVREHLDYDFYCTMARMVPAGDLHELFTGLRDDKKRHGGVVRNSCAALFLIF